MMLKSFGCSFIFGSDLADDVSNYAYSHHEDRQWIRPSKLVWPALLADYYGYDYISMALPGIGNLQILESILKEINQPNNQLFVIQWTWIDRFDYENINRSQSENFWNTLLPGDANQQSQWYFKHVHSQYRDKLSSLIYIKNAIDTLTQLNIPFIMTYLDELLFETQWHTSPAINYLQDYICPHMVKFEGENFLEWSCKKGFPISKNRHPLEQAHQAGFELIKSYNLV